MRTETQGNQICRLFSEVDHHWVSERATTARLAPAALMTFAISGRVTTAAWSCSPISVPIEKRYPLLGLN
jgi:hypothetical protein